MEVSTHPAGRAPSVFVPNRATTLDLFVARWVLGRATPEDATQLAVRALEAGCNDDEVAVIAGSDASTRAELEGDLLRLLRAHGRHLPSQEEALKTLVDNCAQQILEGEVDPVRGAWAMHDFWANEDESTQFFDQVRLFIGLASECDNAGPHLAAYRADIVQEAEAFLERGGLRLPP